MADQVLYVNDVDLDAASGLGVKVGRIDGHRESPTRSVPSAPIPGRDGHVELADVATSGARIIRVDAVQVGSSTSDLLAKLDALKRLVLDGLVRVRTGDHSDREWIARCTLRAGVIGPWIKSRAHSLRFEFRCPDPLAQSLSDSVVDFSGGATQMPLGTAPSLPVIRIGNATNPTLTYKDAAAATIAQMRFTITLGVGEFIDIDCLNQTIIDDQGANQVAALNPADGFIVLDPYDATDVDGPWPTLESSSGTVATATYRKRFL